MSSAYHLASLFVMIGARPRTDWLPAEVDRDSYGFLYTGAEAAACPIPGISHARRILMKRVFRDCLQSETYDPARSNEWHPPSERGRLSSLKFTNSSPHRRAEVTESMRGATRIGLTAAILAVPLLGLVLLLQRPSLDVRWENHPAHFWLVLVTAAPLRRTGLRHRRGGWTPRGCTPALRLARLPVLGRLSRPARPSDPGHLARQEQHRFRDRHAGWCCHRLGIRGAVDTRTVWR